MARIDFDTLILMCFSCEIYACVISRLVFKKKHVEAYRNANDYLNLTLVNLSAPVETPVEVCL